MDGVREMLDQYGAMVEAQKQEAMRSMDHPLGIALEGDTMSEPIKFLATLPTIQSTFTINGQEHEGARLKLDVPGSEIASVVRLLTMRGKVLRVTIEVDE